MTQDKLLQAAERIISRSKAWVTRGDKPNRDEYMQNEQDCIDLRYAIINSLDAPDLEVLEELKQHIVHTLYCSDPAWVKYDNPYAVCCGIIDYLSAHGFLQSQAPSVDDAERKAALEELNNIFHYEVPFWVSSLKEPKLSDRSMHTIRALLSGTAKKVGDGG